MIIIPDIHGRTFWKEPVHESLGREHILFLGDYLDPYEDEDIGPWEALPRFEEIMALKREHPADVTLLLGNHDIHYLTEKGRGSRYDYIRGAQVKQLIRENTDLFQLTLTARAGGKTFLFSHAGILAGWMEHNREYLDDATPESIDDVLNGMWADRSAWPVLFSLLADIPFSRWGHAPYGSPVWSDVDDMRTDAPELPGYYQVFGHSQQEYGPVINDHFACLDCRRAFRLTDEGILEP